MNNEDAIFLKDFTDHFRKEPPLYRPIELSEEQHYQWINTYLFETYSPEKAQILSEIQLLLRLYLKICSTKLLIKSLEITPRIFVTLLRWNPRKGYSSPNWRLADEIRIELYEEYFGKPCEPLFKERILFSNTIAP